MNKLLSIIAVSSVVILVASVAAFADGAVPVRHGVTGQPVPEPSGILAVASGVIGIAGRFGRRRVLGLFHRA